MRTEPTLGTATPYDASATNRASSRAILWAVGFSVLVMAHLIFMIGTVRTPP